MKKNEGKSLHLTIDELLKLLTPEQRFVAGPQRLQSRPISHGKTPWNGHKFAGASPISSSKLDLPLNVGYTTQFDWIYKATKLLGSFCDRINDQYEVIRYGDDVLFRLKKSDNHPFDKKAGDV
jgi:hypothetical protein